MAEEQLGVEDRSLKPIHMPPINYESLSHMRQWGKADERLHAVKQAYLDMWAKARYRPEAPSDGFGNFTIGDGALADPIRLEMEAWIAARRFYEADEEMLFEVRGCSDYRNARTMYLALQAAQLCCSGVEPCIRHVLELALMALPPDPPEKRRKTA